MILMIAKIAMQVIMARQRVSLYQLALANVLLDSIAWQALPHTALSLLDAAREHTALKALVSLMII